MIALCPNSPDHKRFQTVAHVAEEWEVDEHGNFLSNLGAIETVHAPDPDNVWTCCECGVAAVVSRNNALPELTLRRQRLAEVELAEIDDIHGQYSTFPRSEWAHEAGREQTQLGYWDWVRHEIEAADDK